MSDLAAGELIPAAYRTGVSPPRPAQPDGARHPPPSHKKLQANFQLRPLGGASQRYFDAGDDGLLRERLNQEPHGASHFRLPPYVYLRKGSDKDDRHQVIRRP